MSSQIARRVAYIKLLIEDAKWVVEPYLAAYAVIVCPHCRVGFELASALRGELVQRGMFDDVVVELYECSNCAGSVALVQTIPSMNDLEV